jgi:hypothetical protein
MRQCVNYTHRENQEQEPGPNRFFLENFQPHQDYQNSLEADEHSPGDFDYRQKIIESAEIKDYRDK